MSPGRDRGFGSTLAWSCLGLLGSVLVTLAGPGLAGGTVRWWFDPAIPAGLDTGVFYVGIVALCVAWLGLGRRISVRALSTRDLYVIAALWVLPLLLGPALFSRDAYSYLAQGTLVHLGIDPYRHAPAVLAQAGNAHVLGAVDPFWRNTTSPYGPLFLGIVSVVVAVAGSNLVLGVLLLRLMELIGVVLLAVFAPRLARALGADPARTVWWVLLSPLVLLELVAAGHNDVLMVGLLVAGVTLALERRPLLGIAVCALAATIKIPAAAAIVFVAVVWARSAPAPSERTRRLALSAGVTIGVLAAVSLITGLGPGWVSTSVFSTPDKVRLAITPATALGWTVAHLLGDVGIGVSARGLESALGVVAFGLSLLLGAALLWRARRENLVRYLGIALIAAAICGPAAWPWYLCWGLALLAACPGVQESRLIPLGVAASVFAVKGDGILAFPLKTSPVFVVLYLAIAVAAVVVVGRKRPAVRTARLRPIAES